MNINSVSSTSNNTSMPHNDSSSIIKMLEKQKLQLTKQIQSINESKLDEKTKKERVSEVQQQIQQIDAQIQQIKVEEAEERAENNKVESNSSNTTDDQNVQSVSSLSNLVEAKSNLSQAESLKAVKDKLLGQSNVLKMEIKLDAGRQCGETSGKTRQLSNVNSHLSSLDISYGNKLKKAISDAKKSTDEKDGKKPSETDKKEVNTYTSDNTDLKVLTNDKDNSSQTKNEKEDSKQYTSIDISI